MVIVIKDGRLVAQLAADEFNEAVVEKALYWLSGKYRIDYSADKTSVVIDFTPYSELEDVEFHRKTIQNTFLDFKLRHTINEETKTIRELIIAKAFYPIENKL